MIKEVNRYLFIKLYSHADKYIRMKGSARRKEKRALRGCRSGHLLTDEDLNRNELNRERPSAWRSVISLRPSTVTATQFHSSHTGTDMMSAKMNSATTTKMAAAKIPAILSIVLFCLMLMTVYQLSAGGQASVAAEPDGWS